MGDPYLSGDSNTFDEMKSISKFLKSTCRAKMKMKLGRQNSSKVFEKRFSDGRRKDAKGKHGPIGILGFGLIDVRLDIEKYKGRPHEPWPHIKWGWFVG